MVTLICCDPGCEEEKEVLVEDLAQLDELGCECGFGFVLAGVAEAELV